MATSDATPQFTPLECCPLWSKRWTWRNTWTSNR